MIVLCFTICLKKILTVLKKKFVHAVTGKHKPTWIMINDDDNDHVIIIIMIIIMIIINYFILHEQ